jgi:hypothetical protein
MKIARLRQGTNISFLYTGNSIVRALDDYKNRSAAIAYYYSSIIIIRDFMLTPVPIWSI